MRTMIRSSVRYLKKTEKDERDEQHNKKCLHHAILGTQYHSGYRSQILHFTIYFFILLFHAIL